MLTTEAVADGLAKMAAVYRRKVGVDMAGVYHAVLARHLDHMQFVEAVESVLEHEKTFPSPATVLIYGRSFSRNRREVGEPYLRGTDTSLREYVDQLADHKRDHPSVSEHWPSLICELEYQDAATTVAKPPNRHEDPEWSLKFAQAIAAKAEGNLAKIAKIQEAQDAAR